MSNNSHNNNSAGEKIFIGVAIAVISSVSTAIILPWLGLDDKPPQIESNSNQALLEKKKESPSSVSTPPSNEDNPTTTTPSKPETSTKPSNPEDNLEVIELELKDFFDNWSSNPEQIKDNFDFKLNNIKVKFVGYLDQKSIEDCRYNAQQNTRCMALYTNASYLNTDASIYCHNKSEQILGCDIISFSPSISDYMYGLKLAFDPERIEETQKINRLLYSSKRTLTMAIEGKLLFDNKNNFKLVDWQVINYQPYEEY